MTGYFVTDDERGRILWRGTPDDHAPKWVMRRWRGDADENAVFDAAVLLLTEPDDALIERVARHADLGLNNPATRVSVVRAVLAALREEAER